MRGAHETARLHHAGALAWPLAAWAQQSARLPTIGFLIAGTPSSHGRWTAAFAQRLRELGWIEGRAIAIEYRWAEGRNERYSEAAAEARPSQSRCCCHGGYPSTLAATSDNGHPDRVRGSRVTDVRLAHRVFALNAWAGLLTAFLYSCALFRTASATLRAASRGAKPHITLTL